MGLRVFNAFQVKISWRILTILTIIIQSCGIRFFDGQGSLLIIVILFLSRQGFRRLASKDIIYLFLILLFLIVSLSLNTSFTLSKLTFQFGIVLESYIFVLSYKNDRKSLRDDFYQALNLIFIHAAIGYLLYLLLPFLFTATTSFGLTYLTLFRLFYVTELLNGVARNTGLLWEPGLLQLLLNMLIFLSVTKRRSPVFLLTVALVVVTTFSTTGYLALCLNYVYFLLYNFKRNRSLVLKTIVITFLASGSLFFMIDNVLNKFSNENTSGLVRYRDFLVGLELIKEKPLLGHGLFDNAYLLKKSYVSNIESQVFTSEYLAISDEMSGGYTNGLLGFVSWYGIPLSIFVFYLLFNSQLIVGTGYERWIFFLIVVFTLISEPITFTAFFLIFPLSKVVMNMDTRKLFRKPKIRRYGFVGR